MKLLSVDCGVLVLDACKPLGEPVLSPSSQGNLCMVNYGNLFKVVAMGDIAVSMETMVYDSPNTLVDVNDIYRRTYGCLMCMPVRYGNKSLFITYDNFKLYLEEQLTDDYNVVFNWLVPHIVEVSRVQLKD